MRCKYGLFFAMLVWLQVLGLEPREDKHPHFPCTATLTPSAECGRCSLKEWAEKVMTLKERPVQLSSLPSKKAYQKNILSLTEFLSTLQQCADKIAQSCSKKNSWLHNRSLHEAAPDIFTLDRPFTKPIDSPANFTFKPYTCRVRTKPGARFALFGDLHGSVHSLIRDLLKLQDLGYLDNNFKIKPSNFTILFLGDYIDRGIYGVEVMYTIARLLLENPNHVILSRGNHEDYILAPEFREKHTKEEEKDNAPSLIDELYRKFDLSQADEVTIYRLYELLPQAVYVCCGTAQHQDAMMCCHGGLELGYNPYELLHAPDTVRYELIGTLWRKKNFNSKLTKQLQNDIKLAFDLDTLCADVQDFVPLAPDYPVTPHHKAYIGFMWNDFYVDPTKRVGQRSKKFTGWVMGQELTESILAWGTSKKVTLHGVFRAHQHNNDTGGPMLNLLCCSKGMVDVWKNNRIFTFLSAPDSKLEDTGEQCFTYDSFVLLTTAQKFEQWRLEHYMRDTAIRAAPWSRNVIDLNYSKDLKSKSSTKNTVETKAKTRRQACMR